MSPSKKTTRGKSRCARKPSSKTPAGKKSAPVKPSGLDPVHRQILEDYWSHLPAPPDEDEWMSGRI